MALHPTMIFVAVAHAICLVGLLWRPESRFRDLGRPIAGLILSATLTLQIYAFVLPQMAELYLRAGAGASKGQFEWKSPVWMINETIRGLDLGLGFGWLGLLGAGALFACGLGSILARSRLTAACFLLPGLLGGSAMILLGRNLWPRFFFNSASFAVLIAVQGAWVIGSFVARRTGRTGSVLSVALASLLIVASLVTVPKVYRYPKQDFTGARDFVSQQMQAGDHMVALDLAGSVYRKYYGPEISDVDSLAELESQISPKGCTWVLYTLSEHLAVTSPALWEEIQSSFEEVRAFPGTLGGGTIVVRRRCRPAAG